MDMKWLGVVKWGHTKGLDSEGLGLGQLDTSEMSSVDSSVSGDATRCLMHSLGPPMM